MGRVLQYRILGDCVCCHTLDNTIGGIMAKGEYTSREVADLLKLKPRTIKYWTDYGLVHPDISPSRGKGVERLFSQRNVTEFEMVEFMTRGLKIQLNFAKHILEEWRDYHDRKMCHL